MKKLAVSALLFLALASGHAAASVIETGADLVRTCLQTEAIWSGQDGDRVQSLSCFHFLMGFDSGASVAAAVNETPDLYCQPEEARLINMVTAVLDTVDGNARLENAPAAIATWQALAITYPCD
ncbi:Rap1a/Tai family immunity protein [Alkalilimnicola ehrlichii]|uniref:Rap1a immunity protein domain-containing protein n=1 Tax=Alkalilimnicola ehrlichii TaxID=351052 RepID=A0A3E0WT25_9GAMM|nr:Rap1a/Tai family immunity protein [Alkalilimnicola ehrlichii]RFA35117.1 hypothetical protein CAL65_13500 [Alkalilimnicola ehrlichii]